jgi:hypothetical protein
MIKPKKLRLSIFTI